MANSFENVQKSKSPLRYEWFNQLRRFSVVFQKNVHVGMIQFDGLEWLNDLLDNVKEKIAHLFAVIQSIGDVDNISWNALHK